MLRRLHLDEASRASHLRAPSKEGENQGNQGESDLALEFSRPVSYTHLRAHET